MVHLRIGSGRGRFVTGVLAVGALFSLVCFAGGCKKESANERAGREAREAFEKGKDLLKEGFDKTKEITKDGLEKGGDVAKDGLEKTQEAAKSFSKGWNEGGKQ